jgi:hypothetical protein
LRYLTIILSALAAIALPIVVYPWLLNLGLPEESAKIRTYMVVKSPMSWMLVILYFTFFLAASGVYNHAERVLPRKIRLLAVIAGCFGAIALLGFSALFSVSAIPLIMGALVQPKLPYLGRWLISVAAPALSMWIILGGGVFWLETLRGGNPFLPYLLPMVLSVVWMVSPILFIWCDVALLLEAFQNRRAHLYAIRPE